jgi:hypothetical protein
MAAEGESEGAFDDELEDQGGPFEAEVDQEQAT